ncbi:MAG: hypothetical protein EXR62_10950 [Chloroflexi bacterium]|nr:hypothetical protein [Chloroflexota bacterium]
MPGTSWYGPEWKYRRKIALNPPQRSEGNLVNFPVLLLLPVSGLKISGTSRAHLLFTANDGVTQLAHEIEGASTAGSTVRTWVKIPQLSLKSSTTIYVYYSGAIAPGTTIAEETWDNGFQLVLHLPPAAGSPKDASGHHRQIRADTVQGRDSTLAPLRIGDPANLAIRDALTVEAWVFSDNPRPESLQALVSQWSILESFDTFDLYDAGHTDGMVTAGFFGGVFDGRYVYFAPQRDDTVRHARVLRYDTHSDFHDSRSWQAYDASHTSGLDTRGYYGAIFDGRYVYFVPRLDGEVFHTRMLRYDTHGAFRDPHSWQAHDLGEAVSHQSAAFDGRYIYYVAGYEGTYHGPGLEGPPSGKMVRYDTQGDFATAESYTWYDVSPLGGLPASGGLPTYNYDGAVFDGRYVYFVPLEYGVALRYDTTRAFTDAGSWEIHDARRTSGLEMGWSVGAAFDGRYVYYVPYASSTVVRYDSRGAFNDPDAWIAYDASHTSGLHTQGYDGAVFDGRYITFIPYWEGGDMHRGHHARVLRYDTTQAFTVRAAWSATDAAEAVELGELGFNGAAFDGRYMYFVPWRGNVRPDETFLTHGKVVRYDTSGDQAVFSLRYMDYGHNGGLGGSLPGASFLVNTTAGVLNVQSHRPMTPGWHHLVGVFDHGQARLYLDGQLAGEHTGAGALMQSSSDIGIGKILDGLGQFQGKMQEVRLSDVARSASWIWAAYQNLSGREGFVEVGEEERSIDV